jgi:preprotein translocase subunit SecG
LKKGDVPTYISIAQIVLSVALILAILFQVRGGGLGGIFGQPDTVYRTKRGMAKTLFQITIVLIILFIVVSILTIKMG